MESRREPGFGAPRIGGAYGLYGPDSVAWRLNREATLLLAAGPRALLMQLAHPLVAEGVEQHSGFREDPWGRLHGTLASYLRIVYGSEPAARAEIARLDDLHSRVRGPVRDPIAHMLTDRDSYAAREPGLELWVHATLVDSTIVAYEAWIEPLAPDDRARFYAETRPIARAFGIPDQLIPADYAAFEAYLADMLSDAGPVHVTPTSRELAQTILHPPLAPVVGTLDRALGDRPALGQGILAGLGAVPARLYDWTMWPALDQLPPSLRAEYGLPDTPVRRAAAAWLAAAFRLWRPVLPTSFRWMPQARAADARVGASQRAFRATGLSLGAGPAPRTQSA